MQTVHHFSLARQIKNMEVELQESIMDVMKSQQFIGGRFVESFEQKLAGYLNTPHVISCNSGTDALWLALKALDIKPDTIVLTTPFSFIASCSEIVAHDAHPVFIDINPDTYNICPKKLALWLEHNAHIVNGATVHKQTNMPIVGIIAVDIFGQCADYDAIKEVASTWNLWIIEDTAQALGAQYRDAKAGTLGDIGCFSFYPTKNLGAYGDAGCCCTKSPELAEKLLRLRNHGRKTNYDYVEKGINSRLDGIQASILSLKLDHLNTWNTRRAQIAARYNDALRQNPNIKVPLTITGVHVYHQYCIKLATPELRTQLEQYLAEQGIGTRIFYPKSLQDFDFINTRPELATDCPIARNLTQTVLSLPMWPELTDQEVDAVINAILTAPALTLISPAKEMQSACSC